MTYFVISDNKQKFIFKGSVRNYFLHYNTIILTSINLHKGIVNDYVIENFKCDHIIKDDRYKINGDIRESGIFSTVLLMHLSSENITFGDVFGKYDGCVVAISTCDNNINIFNCTLNAIKNDTTNKNKCIYVMTAYNN